MPHGEVKHCIGRPVYHQTMSHFPAAAMDALAKLVQDEMRDWCTITREAPGPGTIDEVTGEVTITLTTIYDGQCMIGDRIEGAFASGGFGANPQEWAYDSRSHNAVLRLPPCKTKPEVGDLVQIRDGDRWRIVAEERATHRVSSFYRIVFYDPDASRS